MRTIRPEILGHQQYELIKENLHNMGYAAVHIPTIDNKMLKEQYAKDLSSITGQNLNAQNLFDVSTELPTANYAGLLGEYGLCQGDSVWSVRTDPTILSIFTHLLDVPHSNDLVCSMDAIAFATDVLIESGPTWLHVDQNPNSRGGHLNSIQGIYYAEPSISPDNRVLRGTTVLVPGSHKEWHTHQFGRSHFVRVDQSKYEDDAVRVELPASTLLLFSSKTVHQGWHGPHRLCFMVSYGCKYDRDEMVRRQKVMYYLGGHRTTHWSQYGQCHGKKWFSGDYSLKMLIPQVTPQAESFDISLMLDDELVSVEDYQPEYDTYIPADRLVLM